MRKSYIDELRSTLTILVVAHHCALAYAGFASKDPTSYLRSSAPIVDQARWASIDYFIGFNDTFFMSLMFFVSGLFLLPSLNRRGALDFVRERLQRLAIPFVIVLVTLMPLAYYASWLSHGGAVGFADYWRLNLTRHGFTPGPLWFVWLLLLFDIIAAGAFALWSIKKTDQPKTAAMRGFRPFTFFAIMAVVIAAVYIPPLLHFGFSHWSAFISAPFFYQTPRLGLYFAWFVGGIVVGSRSGLINEPAESQTSALSGVLWGLSAICAYLISIWLPRENFASRYLSSDELTLLAATLWVLANVAGCVGLFQYFKSKAWRPTRLLAAITPNAYAIYLVHYVFVLWLQYALLGMDVPALAKFAVAFLGALLLSLLTAIVLRRVPVLRTYI